MIEAGSASCQGRWSRALVRGVGQGRRSGAAQTDESRRARARGAFRLNSLTKNRPFSPGQMLGRKNGDLEVLRIALEQFCRAVVFSFFEVGDVVPIESHRPATIVAGSGIVEAHL